MQLQVIVVVVHQGESRLARLGTGDHLHADRGRTVAIPLAAAAEQFRHGLVRVEHDNRYDSKQLGHRDGAILRNPYIPVCQRLVDRRGMEVADEGELEQNLPLLFAFIPDAHTDQCQQADGERHHD